MENYKGCVSSITYCISSFCLADIVTAKMIFSDTAVINKVLAWIQDKSVLDLRTELRSKWVVDYSLLNEDLQGFN